MAIPKIEASLSKLQPWMPSPNVITAPPSSPTGPTQNVPGRVGIGEAAPILASFTNHPDLANLFTQYGLVNRIRRKLTTLSGKKAQIVLAENTIGAADNQGLVYLGADFLRAHQNDTALIAGVMAHEWGHLMSLLIKYANFDKFKWDELLKIRQEEEASADAFCGRILPLMGYSVEPLIEFLKYLDDGRESHKYFPVEMRIKILREASQCTFDRQVFARELFSKDRVIYPNPYTSILLASE